MEGWVQDEDELVQWFAVGRTLRWMCEEYERRYNLVISASQLARFRETRGVGPRTSTLIPWDVLAEHRANVALEMLQAEQRARAGHSLSAELAARLAAWRASLDENDFVVHYDPDTERGFFYVPRRPGIDTDIVRVPR